MAQKPIDRANHTGEKQKQGHGVCDQTGLFSVEEVSEDSVN